MKKFVYVFCLLLASFTFTACPLFFDDLDRHKFMKPEELVAKMNNNFDANFTLVNYEEVIKEDGYEYDDYKYLVVTLETDDLPGKEVRAYQFYSWTYSDDIYTVGEAYSNEARTTIVSVNEYLVTDYYFVKYQDELYSKFINDIYQPLLENLTENDYLFAIKPILLYFPIEEAYYHHQNIYSNVEDILKNAALNTYLLINKEAKPEDEYNSILEGFNKTSYLYNADGKCYYSTKYTAAQVSIDQLVNDNFYSEDDLADGSVVKYNLYY